MLSIVSLFWKALTTRSRPDHQFSCYPSPSSASSDNVNVEVSICIRSGLPSF